MRAYILILTLSLATATVAAQTADARRGQTAARGANPPRYVPADPVNFNDTAGWTRMFDGRSLAGWDGPDLWKVEDGAIVVNSKADPPTGSVYLLYTASQPKDFEFKFEVKLDGAGANSGVQFRATRLGEVEGRPIVEVGNARLSG